MARLLNNLIKCVIEMSQHCIIRNILIFSSVYIKIHRIPHLKNLLLLESDLSNLYQCYSLGASDRARASFNEASCRREKRWKDEAKHVNLSGAQLYGDSGHLGRLNASRETFVTYGPP